MLGAGRRRSACRRSAARRLLAVKLAVQLVEARATLVRPGTAAVAVAPTPSTAEGGAHEPEDQEQEEQREQEAEESEAEVPRVAVVRDRCHPGGDLNGDVLRDADLVAHQPDDG